MLGLGFKASVGFRVWMGLRHMIQLSRLRIESLHS